MSRSLIISILLHILALFAFLVLARGGLSGAQTEESFAVRPVELARERVREQAPMEVPALPRPAPSKAVESTAEVTNPKPKPQVALPGPSYPKARPKSRPVKPTDKEGAQVVVEIPESAPPEPPADPQPSETAPEPTPTPPGAGWEPPARPEAGRPSSGSTPGYSDGEATPVHFPSIRFAELAPGQQLSVMAVFEIRPDGGFEVSLSSGSGDPRLDQLALQTLKTWRWRPRVVNGKAVASREELKVDVVR